MMRYDLHNDVMQVLGPGGQVPAAAAGPGLGVRPRPEDVRLQCPGLPRQPGHQLLAAVFCLDSTSAVTSKALSAILAWN